MCPGPVAVQMTWGICVHVTLSGRGLLSMCEIHSIILTWMLISLVFI
jgi:hypothetical protein